MSLGSVFGRPPLPLLASAGGGGLGDELGDADAELFVDDDDLATGAINVPFTNTSTGAPAARSRSMTAPGVIDNSSRTVMRQRPSSAVTPISTSARTYDAANGLPDAPSDALDALEPGFGGVGKTTSVGHGCRGPDVQRDTAEQVTAVEQRIDDAAVERVVEFGFGVDLGRGLGIDVDSGPFTDRAHRGVQGPGAHGQQDLVRRGPLERLADAGPATSVTTPVSPPAAANPSATLRVGPAEVGHAVAYLTDGEDAIVAELAFQSLRERERPLGRPEDLVELAHRATRRFMGPRSAGAGSS